MKNLLLQHPVAAAEAGMASAAHYSRRSGSAHAPISRLRHVNELFEAGASFITRLNELRLRKAADLLARSEGRISDVAFACGFNGLSYCNRNFRRRSGLTPTAARGR